MKGRLAREALLAAMVAAMAGACSRGTPPGDTAGVTDADAVPKLTFTEVRRFGSEQSPDTGFAGIGGAAVDRSGRIYAADYQDLRIRVFDSTGTLVRMIGRRGEGPGEFQSSPEFGVIGDTLWAVDSRALRLTLFHLDGTVISTARYSDVRVPLPGTSYTIILRPVLMRPDGRFLGSLWGWGYLRQKAPGSRDSVALTPRLLYDPSGAIVDTIGWFRAFAPGGSSGHVEIGGRRYSVPSPQDDQLLTLLLPDGDVLVDRPTPTDEASATFSVTYRTFADDTVYHRAFSYRPRRYPDSFLDTLALRYAVGPFRPGSMPKPDMEAYRAIRPKMHFPTFQPPVQGRFAGADGGVWLRREERGGKTYEWLVLRPDGAARGRIELPGTTHVLWSRGSEVLASVPDSLGVPWLVRYRLGPS